MAIKPYVPEALPIKTLDKAVLFTAVGEANAALARYDGLLTGMINPAVMLSVDLHLKLIRDLHLKLTRLS